MTSKTKTVAIYARVSTDGQTTKNQLLELREIARRHDWVIVKEYVDHGISGSKGRKDRPQFNELLNGVARKEFDMVAAWAVDRLGRSLQDLMGFLSELQSKGVHLYLHQQALDTSTPAGKAMFGMFGVFAEFERSMIQERVRSGLERARKNGTRSGRPIGRPQTSPEIELKILELASQGMGMLKIARTLKIGTSVAQRVLAAPPAGD